MLGNFIADFINPGEYEKLSKDVRTGVELHRFIDTFTDTHPVVLQTRKRLYPYFSKYAAVVQDVFYDHYLAANWSEYSEVDLKAYCQRVYFVLNKSKAQLNTRATRVLYYMEMEDWLYNYRETEGIDRALKGLARRAKFKSGMDKALPALEKHYSEINTDFGSFFPELKAAVLNQFTDEPGI